MVKKAELHVHLEGTATPELIRRLAVRNKVKLPDRVFNDDHNFSWKDFPDFLDCYEAACQAIKSDRDYYDITFEYLKRCAEEDTIYVEMMYSPVHAEMSSGIPSHEHLNAIQEAIEDAEKQLGIISGVIMTGVRHYGLESVIRVAKDTEKRAHSCIIGFGMAGEESRFPPADFKKAFEIARGAGLECTVHAGEVAGAHSVREAIEHLPVGRIGHGVRSIEEEKLVKELAERNIVLEVCPTSNVAIKAFSGYDTHPFRKLYDAGIKLTLNTDDPPYFNTTIGKEYEMAKKHFGLSDDELLEITKNAIRAAFIDQKTREKLLASL